MACVGSTEAEATPGEPPAAFDASRPYELHPQVALRHEPFGALAYHYGNRRLSFLRSSELVGVLQSLAEHDSAGAALDDAGVDRPSRRLGLEKALGALLSSGVIRAR